MKKISDFPLFAGVFLLGCSGVLFGPDTEGASVSNPNDPPTPDPSASGDNGIPQPDAEGNLPYTPPSEVSPTLQARTWKLSNEQYRRSIEALLGVEVSLLDADGIPRLPPEIHSGTFRNLALSGFVSTGLADDYHRMAEEVTDALRTDEIAALVPCGLIEASCRDDFLRTTLGRAFRRPATEEDLARFSTLFELAHAQAGVLGDPAAGFRAVLRGLLTSPHFVYRTEIGTDASEQQFVMTDYEVAAFLSYSLLDQPPDEALLAAARRGELTDLAALQSTVRTLLERPAAQAKLRDFMLELLEVDEFERPEAVDKDLPSFEEVRGAMMDETLSFLAQYGGMDGRPEGLLAAPVPMPAGALGSFYVSEPTSADADPIRTGVLALGTVLASHSKEGATSPTLRGYFIRERLLCQDFPVPPNAPDVGEVLAREQPRTTREMYEIHASAPACSECHRLIDGIGVTFESLDEVGRLRYAENGVPVDTSGELIQTDVNAELLSHTDLAEALARSEWVRECLSRQAFRYYFGLATSASRDADGTRAKEDRGLPPIQAGRQALGAGTFSDLLTAILTTPSTLSRTRHEPPAGL